MLQRWSDHEGAEHRVLDDYNRNVVLCDLTAQPADIREIINTTITENAVPKEITQVGMRLMKFLCQVGYATYCRSSTKLCRTITSEVSSMTLKAKPVLKDKIFGLLKATNNVSVL